jgi:hypothetical protein
MSDMTRKDAGAGLPKLVVTIEMDLTTSLVTVETNVHDPSVMLRLVGQGMHIWSDNEMKSRVSRQQSAQPGSVKRPLMLPGRRGD